MNQDITCDSYVRLSRPVLKTELQVSGLKRVDCRKLSNVSAYNAVAIFRMNMLVVSLKHYVGPGCFRRRMGYDGSEWQNGLLSNWRRAPVLKDTW